MSTAWDQAAQQRELVAAWSRAEKAETAVLKLQRENEALRAELKRERNKQAGKQSDEHDMAAALDRLAASAER